MRPAEARSSLFVHPMHGVVRPTFVAHDSLTARISDAVALAGRHHVIGGWAALRIHGVPWFDGLGPDGTDDPVPVHCMPGGQLRRRREVEPWRGRLLPEEIVDLGAYRIATVGRAVFDVMRRAASWREAVVALDMAISTVQGRAAPPSLEDVREVMVRHRKVRGIVQAEKALSYGSSRSASPLESRTRLVAEVDAEITGLLVNVPIFGHGATLLGVADLFDPATGHVIESDGAGHREEEQHAHDVVRDDRFGGGGLAVSRVTAYDHRDRSALAARLRAANERARRRSGIEASWTLDPPDWWHGWPAARRWE